MVDDGRDHLDDVVGLPGGGRDDLADTAGGLSVGLGVSVVVGVQGGADLGRGGQVGQEGADLPQRVLLVVGHVVDDAGDGTVDLCTAEVLGADLLTGCGAYDVGAGDEHVRGLAGGDDEVGQGRAVDGAAGAGAQDDADLRDQSGGGAGAVEDAPVLAQSSHALLDLGAAGVDESDDGDA